MIINRLINKYPILRYNSVNKPDILLCECSQLMENYRLLRNESTEKLETWRHKIKSTLLYTIWQLFDFILCVFNDVFFTAKLKLNFCISILLRMQILFEILITLVTT